MILPVSSANVQTSGQSNEVW